MHAERAALARDLAEIPAESWHHQTLCGEWNVEQVVAHLCAAANTKPSQWIRSMLAAGFRPAIHNRRRLSEWLGPNPEITFQNFKNSVNLTVAPSKDTAAYLGEVAVHAQDIRQPLGLGVQPSVDALTPVADFFVKRNFAVRSKSIAHGLELTANDGTFRAGEGPAVGGSTLALVMVMAGRSAYLSELNGPGVTILRNRLSIKG